MLLGCIGDDFTGSSDLANTLTKQGMRTVQYTGVPIIDATPNVEAGVIALKSRSISVTDAVQQSLDALIWLQAQGCRQFFLKYCSTFDSTPQGNIGPVIDALADGLGADQVIVCPAFPGAGRTLYQGHLFVYDLLLNESGMQNHPLTPMTDPDIRRWLEPQTRYKVGHVPMVDVLMGVVAIRAKLASEQAADKRLIVVDAIQDEDLMTISKAAFDLPLITGGSGVAMGLPANFRSAGAISAKTPTFVGENGPCAVLCGSCSRTTRAQIERHQESNPTFAVDPVAVINSTLSPADVCAWVLIQEGVPLVYSCSADPTAVAAIQQQYGREASANALEAFFAELARQFVANGGQRLVVAGGETSGAVVEGLNIASLQIGPEIDPGIPVMRASDSLVIALKSGNFGTVDFFAKAAQALSGRKLT